MTADDVILAVNPGSVTTKLAVYLSGSPSVVESLNHANDDWAKKYRTVEQLDFRVRAVKEFLERCDRAPSDLTCVVARGGLLRPVRSGVYRVNDAMIEDLRAEYGGRHASNLGGLIARRIAEEGGIQSYIVDPVSVDEYSPEARVSGFPPVARRSFLHALNMKAAARRASTDLGMPLEDLYLVVVHLGSGFSISPHYRGFLRDANNSSEEGPFTPERAGTVPSMVLWDLERSAGSLSEVKNTLTGESGMYGYLGTKDAREAESWMADDPRVEPIFRGMAYQVAKEIGAMASAYPERPDAVVLTGGLARSAFFVEAVKERTSFIAPHLVYPGEDEMESLCSGVRRVLLGREMARVYPGGEVDADGDIV